MPSASAGNTISNPAQFVAGVVDAAAIATDAVDSAEIKADAVGASEIAANAVGDSEIAAHTTTKITVPSSLLSVASEAQGDLLIRSTSNWIRLAAGTAGNFLKTNGASADPAWTAISSKVIVGGVPSGYTGANSAAELTAITTTIPANTLGTAGMVRGRAYFSALNCHSTNMVVRLYYGTTVIGTITTSTAMDTNGIIDFCVFGSGATNSQLGVMNMLCITNGEGAPPVDSWRQFYATGTATENSTGALTFKLTIQYGSTAANSRWNLDAYTVDSVS